MTKRELFERMSAEEFYEWWSYFMLDDEDYYKKIKHQVSLEKSAEMTEEQRAQSLIDQFKAMKQNGSRS